MAETKKGIRNLAERCPGRACHPVSLVIWIAVWLDNVCQWNCTGRPMISYLSLNVVGLHISESFVTHASFAMAYCFPHTIHSLRIRVRLFSTDVQLCQFCHNEIPKKSAATSCGVSKKNLANSGLDFFLVVMRLIAVGSSHVFHLRDIFRNLPFSLFCAMTSIVPGFTRLCYRVYSLRWTSFIASDPSFVIIKQSPRSGFDFAIGHLTLSLRHAVACKESTIKVVQECV